MTLHRFPVLLIVAILAAPAAAQVKYPPRAETVDVAIRYRIRADRDERIQQFRTLTAHLAKLGFVANPREDSDLDILDPFAERFDGTIPSARVLDVLKDPRVLAIQFAPAGTMLPDDQAKPVPVRIGLAVADLTSRERKSLHSQAVEQLERLGFIEAVGYDHQNFSLIRGSIPAGKLSRLLKDLRGEPGGWFLPDEPTELLPAPLKDVYAIRWIEVLPDADIAPFAPPAPVGTGKISEPLKAALAAGTPGPIRIEAVLDRPVVEILEPLRNKLRADYAGSAIDGVTGFVVSVSFAQPAAVERFANEPEVTAIRLPRAGTETMQAPAAGAATPAAALAAMRLDRLHALGQKGQGVRVIVIGSDFTGAAEQIGKDLPKGTRVIDLTAELSPKVEPLPADAVPGRGAAAARAAAAAAAGAELVLVRVNRDSFFQLGTIARFVRGNTDYSDAMQSRIDEMSRFTKEIAELKTVAVDEYRKAFADLSDDDKAIQRRDAARKILLDVIAQEKDVAARIQRYSALQDAMSSLAGGNIVVVNSLVWESGFPLDGLSSLSRAIDEFFAGEAMKAPTFRSATRPFPPNAPLWVQAASDIPGSVWGGPYLDLQGNGVMDFAPANAPLPAGLWSHELNFLGGRGADGMTSSQLATGSKLRITVQWREAHHPDVYVPPDPILPITLRVLRQLDPDGEKRASDEMEEVARSTGPAIRLLAGPNFGVYEQSLEFAAPADGRYALRVEARPAFDHRLPALRQEIEIHPRIVVEYAAPSDDGSRPVFTTFVPPTGGVGIAGDSPSALTIGAEKSGPPVLAGGGPGTVLLEKPNLLAPATLAGEPGGRGTGIAAAYAAGLSASLIGSGSPSADILRSLHAKPGDAAVIPEVWLKWVRPR